MWTMSNFQDPAEYANPEIGDVVINFGQEAVIVGFYGDGGLKLKGKDRDASEGTWKASLHKCEFAGPLYHGGHSPADSDDGYSYNWRCIPRWAAEAVCQEDEGCSVDEVRTGARLARILTGWQAHYRGPGRSFTHVPYAKATSTRVLIKQACGYDI
jgi:hypothetical protein